MLDVLPCICFCARATVPPKAWPMDWWPRQTPRMGVREWKRRMRSREIPPSSGVPGPGEITMPSGSRRSTSSTVILSLRATFIVAPSSPRYWTRL